MPNNRPKIQRVTKRKTVRIHGWIIEHRGARAMTINGPGGDDVICLFTHKAHAEKVLLSYAAGYGVKHYGLIELDN